uniref:Major facilitator superfamily (MFS) profile domain-containing protein n=1 Tax=Bubo bubo TaxID=30461 RepID=A0A8C0E8D2_BUBBB
MQLCGNDSMYFYAAYVFQEAGIPQDKIPYVVIGTGSCELITSVTCNMIIDYAGRRPLLLGGYIFMAGWAIVFMVALSQQVTNFTSLFKWNGVGLLPFIGWDTQISWMPYLSMACIFAYILSFGIGPGQFPQCVQAAYGNSQTLFSHNTLKGIRQFLPAVFSCFMGASCPW